MIRLLTSSTPMKADDHLDGSEERLYNYITQHFIASLLPNYKFVTATCQVQLAGETFSFESIFVIFSSSSSSSSSSSPFSSSPFSSSSAFFFFLLLLFSLYLTILDLFSGKRTTEEGFTLIWPTQAHPASAKIVAQKGDPVKLSAIKLDEGMTSPPSYLTESDLIEQV
jgi:DNA topoisomerase IA